MELRELNGIINVLKPPGMTSHDVIGFLRRTLKIKKAGHTGTLDPGVAGVLAVYIGKATRIIEFVEDNIKRYRAEITFGRTTDTQDAFGEIVGTADASGLTPEQVDNILKTLVGEHCQLPPMVSAVKHKGKRLYELARQGIEVERKRRPVRIFDIKVIGHSGFGLPNPRVMFDIICSRGTYVRTLCHDTGETLGCGGHMSFLLRTATGSFNISESLTLEEISDLAQRELVYRALVPLGSVLPFPEVRIDMGAADSVRHGNRIKYSPESGFCRREKLIENTLVKLTDPYDRCLAVARVAEIMAGSGQACDERDGDEWEYVLQPVKVLC